MNEQELLKVQKMTKAEMIEYFQHLDDTVQAKDREINKLKEEHQEEIGTMVEKHRYEVTQLKNTQTREVLKNEVKRELEKEYAPLIEEIAKLQEDLNKKDESHANVDVKIANLEAIIKQKNQHIVELLAIHGGVLKQIQGMLDNELRLNEYYVEKVTK